MPYARNSAERRPRPLRAIERLFVGLVLGSGGIFVGLGGLVVLDLGLVKFWLGLVLCVSFSMGSNHGVSTSLLHGSNSFIVASLRHAMKCCQRIKS